MTDIVMRVSAVPVSGADVLASERLVTTGGGYNAMSAAARQGMGVLYGGRLGTGPFSEFAFEALRSDGIATPIEPDPDLDVGFCVVLVDDVGERTFVTSPGAEATLRASDLDVLDVSADDVVLVSGYNVMYAGQSELILRWIGSLARDVVVAFDPSNRVMDIPKANLEWMLARSDWLLCNETEATSLSAVVAPEQSVSILAGRSGRGVVVRHGATGCTVGSGSSTPTHIAGFAVRVVDTNGAGDIHSGVFLAELARGTDVVGAARRANAASSVAIGVLGPAACPTRELVTDLVSQFAS